MNAYPTFAPAILTVGSIEYQLGREHEAMTLFHSLVKLAANTLDLEEVIDKAGDTGAGVQGAIAHAS